MLRRITTEINTLDVLYLRCYVFLQLHGSFCVPEYVLVLVVNFCSFELLPRVEVQCFDGQGGRSASTFWVAELFQIGCRSNKEEGNVVVTYSGLKGFRQSQIRKVGGGHMIVPSQREPRFSVTLKIAEM
jgi:hypothetical protein